MQDMRSQELQMHAVFFALLFLLPVVSSRREISESQGPSPSASLESESSSASRYHKQRNSFQVSSSGTLLSSHILHREVFEVSSDDRKLRTRIDWLHQHDHWGTHKGHNDATIHNGWRSQNFLEQWDETAYLQQRILHSLEHALDAEQSLLQKGDEHVATHTSSRVSTCQVFSIWANKLPSGGSSELHLHPNAHYAGVYYLEVPRTVDPQIFFDVPKEGKQEPTGASVMDRSALDSGMHLWDQHHLGENCEELGVYAQAGHLLLWPGWLGHRVPQQRIGENDTRVSVAFNVECDGHKMPLRPLASKPASKLYFPQPAFLQAVQELYHQRTGTERMAPLLYAIVRALEPFKAIEVGAGYTTMFLGEALRDADCAMSSMTARPRRSVTVVSTFTKTAHYTDDQPFQTFVSANELDPYVTVINGDIFEWTQGGETLRAGGLAYDFVWVDTKEAVADLFWESTKREHGTLLVHSTLSNWRKYNWLQKKKALSGQVLGLDLQVLSLYEPHKEAQNSFSFFAFRPHFLIRRCSQSTLSNEILDRNKVSTLLYHVVRFTRPTRTLITGKGVDSPGLFIQQALADSAADRDLDSKHHRFGLRHFPQATQANVSAPTTAEQSPELHLYSVSMELQRALQLGVYSAISMPLPLGQVNRMGAKVQVPLHVVNVEAIPPETRECGKLGGKYDMIWVESQATENFDFVWCLMSSTGVLVAPTTWFARTAPPSCTQAGPSTLWMQHEFAELAGVTMVRRLDGWDAQEQIQRTVP